MSSAIRRLMPDVMPANSARSGVCIVRVEVQPDYLLITVTINRALNRNLHAASAGDVLRFSDPEQALGAVAEFLRSYQATGLPLGDGQFPGSAGCRAALSSR